MLLELAVLKNFDAGTYKAGVQLVGSLTTYFDDVPVSRAIPTSALVIGNHVILAIPGDNPKDACVIAAWPQGSPGGAEVHGNEYHDPDFASEAAFLAHKIRHQYGGADELMLDPAQVVSLGRAFYHFDGQVEAGWTQAYTGSAYGNLLPIDVDLETGSTISSIAKIYRTSASNRLSPVQNSSPKYVDFIFKVCFATKTDQEMWLVSTSAGASYPSPNGGKVGFRIVNDIIYAHCANGTNSTQVQIATISPWSTIILRFEACDSNVRFYVNGALAATISTNIPAHTAFRIMLAVYNAAAANKRFILYNMEIILPI